MFQLTAPKVCILYILIFIGIPVLVKAQVKADFTTDKQTGCAPLVIQFTNTSTGTSATATFEWSFGNGNTSALRNPGAVFLEEKTYNITLTVRDGAQMSTVTRPITVRKKPVVQFSALPVKGCTPMPVAFNSSSTAFDGNIVNYLWDFGDGTTENSNNAGITHIYQTALKAAVTLTVTDEYGCANTKTLKDVAEVFQGVKASFEADKSFVCTTNEKIKFTNTTKGSGTLKYHWLFGDGKTSTEKEPEHAFTDRGSYTVQLAVQNERGCTDTLVKTAYLNVGNFQSEIKMPETVCKNTELELESNNVPRPDFGTWRINGGDTIVKDIYYGTYKYKFTVAGNHTISLSNHFGNCIQTVTKQIRVLDILQPKGFIAEVPDHCFAPVGVQFKDTTTGSVQSEWDFERLTYPTMPQRSGKSLTFTYYQANNYLVTLWVTDSNGCRNSVEQYVRIDEPHVAIIEADDKGVEGCETLTKKFKIVTDENLTSHVWDFGDGGSSSDLEPEHTFKASTFLVRLTYTTVKGCKKTVSGILISD